VRVDVYPRRDGHVVEGLTADDLEVFEDGVPQLIETFEFVRVAPFTPDADRRDPSSMADAERQAADPGTRVFILYLDGQHMQLEGARAATRPALDFLMRSMGPRDLFGVMTPGMTIEQMTLGRRLDVVEQEIANYWDDVFRDRATESILYPESPHEQFLYECYFARGDDLVRRLWTRARAERALENLRWLANRLGGIREFRSHVLLFSGGWDLPGPDAGLTQRTYGEIPQIGAPGGRITIGSREPGVAPNTSACDAELARLAFIDFRRLFDDVLEAADAHNVSFYPIDTAGLAAFDAPAGSRRVGGFFRGNRRLDSLRSLAFETGGVSIVGTNNIIEPLRQIADEFASFYLLGYYSTNGDFDGKYREIEVRTRLDDVDITARRGYLAPSAEMVAAMTAPAEPEAEAAPGFAEALNALGRLDSGAEVFVTGAARAGEVVIVAEADESALGRAIPDGAAVSVELAETDGQVIGTERVTLEPGVRGTAVRFPVDPASAGPWRATVSVDDGAVTERVEVARGAPAPVGARLVYRARQARTSPLWPVAQMSFRRAERVHVEWVSDGPLANREARLLGPDGDTLAVPVMLSERDVDGHLVLAADLTLAPLGAGDYVIEVTATSGGRTVQDFVALRVSR